MADQCEQMLKISSEFVRLQVSHDEYLCMKVLLLLSTGQTFHFRAAELSHVEGAVAFVHHCMSYSSDQIIFTYAGQNFTSSLN